MKDSKPSAQSTVVSLDAVVEEIQMLFNDGWTAYINRRTGEL